MSVIKKIERMTRNLFRLRTLPDPNLVRNFLEKEYIWVADVGATGKPKSIWDEARDFCHFFLFDPEPRSNIECPDSASVYNMGLWSGKTKKKLFLAVNPEASSVFHFNSKFLSDFLNAPLHKVVDTQIVDLDSMSNIVGDRNINFIKIDAEGAELEILRGAQSYLCNGCLGVFIEVSFAERHSDAPLFGEIDAFMRSHNFMLMDLYLERWIRSNNNFGLFSRPQVIWANALYLLSRDEFLSRLRAAAPISRETLFAKFVIILTLYEAHDYAMEITIQTLSNNLISKEKAEQAKQIIAAGMANSRSNLARLFLSVILSCLGLVVFLPYKKLRQNNLLFLKLQFGELCAAVCRFSTHRYTGAIVDPVDPSSRL